MYQSTKTYGNDVGLSCTFRQWKADSHCNKLHGYSLGFRFSGAINLPPDTPCAAETHPSLNTGAYIDIVVDEIPYGACKQNPRGLNIIHRLPITTSTNTQTIGPIVHYKSGYFNNDNQHLFPPINLSHLTIHLYMDGQELPLENLTISFEFELVILNK